MQRPVNPDKASCAAAPVLAIEKLRSMHHAQHGAPGSQSGDAAACKAVYAGSIPTPASSPLPGCPPRQRTNAGSPIKYTPAQT